MAKLDVARIGHARLDLRERDFVAGEMNDFAGNRRPRSEAENRQKLVQEPRTARYVRAREFSAVARFAFVNPAQVTNIVEQAGDYADNRALATEAHRLLGLTLITNDESCERQRDIECVLAIVVNRIDAVVSRDLSSEHAFEMLERNRERFQRLPRPSRAKERLYRGEHSLRRAHLNGIGDVEIASPDARHFSL